jgi:cytochrome P450
VTSGFTPISGQKKSARYVLVVNVRNQHCSPTTDNI